MTTTLSCVQNWSVGRLRALSRPCVQNRAPMPEQSVRSGWSVATRTALRMLGRLAGWAIFRSARSLGRNQRQIVVLLGRGVDRSPFHRVTRNACMSRVGSSTVKRRQGTGHDRPPLVHDLRVLSLRRRRRRDRTIPRRPRPPPEGRLRVPRRRSRSQRGRRPLGVTGGLSSARDHALVSPMEPRTDLAASPPLDGAIAGS